MSTKVEAQLARGGVRIRIKTDADERDLTFYGPSVTIGRANSTGTPDVDLSHDINVSRNHARLWVDQNACWLEDLGSRYGTRVRGIDISGKGRVPVDANSPVEIGGTTLLIEPLGVTRRGFTELPKAAAPSTVEIGKTLSRSAASELPSLDATQRQGMLLEILVQFSLPARLDQLLQTITTRVVELIPGAKRGALLLSDAGSDKLVLAAFVSRGAPAVSETLARRALEQREAFVWRNSFGFDPAVSIQRHRIQSGMYAPLVFGEQTLGVLCVDNPDTHEAFSDDDLQLLVAVADHAAVAVHHQQVEEDLSARVKVLDQMLWTVPPSGREKIVQQIASGEFKPGLAERVLPVIAVYFPALAARVTTTTAPEIADLLSGYSDVIAQTINQFGGWVCLDSAASVAAVFTAENNLLPNALESARALAATLASFNKRQSATGALTSNFTVAVACDKVVYGFVHANGRLLFRAVGPAVDQAVALSCEGGAELVIAPGLESKPLAQAA